MKSVLFGLSVEELTRNILSGLNPLRPYTFITSFFINISLAGQTVQTNISPPDLEDRGFKIENQIIINTSKSTFRTLQDTIGQKIKVKSSLLIINGDTLIPEEISTRGQSTLHFVRKSFSFTLSSKAILKHGEEADSLRKFYALSLSMDRCYSNNRLAYEMMENCGLFGLFYTFCDVRINGKSDGIHMIVERPHEWAMKKMKSPLLIRRGYNESIEKLETGNVVSGKEAERYCNLFREIYRDIDKYYGEELYKAISSNLDIDEYMKWIAFNFLIRNGDYTDEVFFYLDTALNKFRIIPWDYDDVFMLAPHEGKDIHKDILGGKLIFSAEDLLDKKIVTDPYLYRVYMIKFRELLDCLKPDLVKSIFENTYSELFPYYSDREIIGMAAYDVYNKMSIEKLRMYLFNLYDNLLNSRFFYFNYLNSETGGLQK